MVVEAQERERRQLTGLKLTLDVHDRLSSGDAAVRLERARDVVELLRRVHDLSLDLRPSVLDDLGLHAAFVCLVQRYGDQTGVHVALQCSGLQGRLRPEVETAAYRIVQEALTNVARHAGVDRSYEHKARSATCSGLGRRPGLIWADEVSNEWEVLLAESAAAAGIVTLRPVRSGDGQIVETLNRTRWRVYEQPPLGPEPPTPPAASPTPTSSPTSRSTSRSR